MVKVYFPNFSLLTNRNQLERLLDEHMYIYIQPIIPYNFGNVNVGYPEKEAKESTDLSQHAADWVQQVMVDLGHCRV